MALNLLEYISTSQDLKAAILDVRRYAKWYSQAAVKARVAKIDAAQAPAISTPAAAIINQWNKEKPINPKSLDELLLTLERIDMTVPKVVITLAAPAPASLRNTLTQWCRKNIDPNALVDFRFNSTILGGLVIRHKSRIYDWSYRRQILAGRGHFAEVLRRV